MSTSDVPAEREELLPCPFCGEEPHLHEPAFVGDDWQVGCQCGDDEDERNPGAIWRNGKTFEEVAARWNRRAAPQEAREPDLSDEPMTGDEAWQARIKWALREAAESSDPVFATLATEVSRLRRRLAAARHAPETEREPGSPIWATRRIAKLAERDFERVNMPEAEATERSES